MSYNLYSIPKRTFPISRAQKESNKEKESTYFDSNTIKRNENHLTGKNCHAEDPEYQQRLKNKPTFQFWWESSTYQLYFWKLPKNWLSTAQQYFLTTLDLIAGVVIMNHPPNLPPPPPASPSILNKKKIMPRPLLKRAGTAGSVEAKGSPFRQQQQSRRVSFQNDDERLSILKEWKEEQVVFRQELELMWEQQQLEEEQERELIKQATFRWSNKILAWFIIGFLAMIPLLSTYQETHPKNNNNININGGSHENYDTSGSVILKKTSSTTGNGTLNHGSDANVQKQQQQYEAQTMVVSVSHVDYSMLGTPKSTVLKLQQNEAATTLSKQAIAACPHQDQQQQEIPPAPWSNVNLFQSRPLWTLQQQQSESEAPLSWTSVAIIRQHNQQNETIVAVALLSDHHYSNSSANDPSSTTAASSFRLDFVPVPWHQAEEAVAPDTSETFFIRMMHEVSVCSTWNAEDEASLMPPMISWPYLSEPMRAKNLPTIRGKDPLLPPFPLRDYTKNKPAPQKQQDHLLFFGSDSTFREMERYYQYYRVQYELTWGDKTEDQEQTKVSARQRAKQIFQRSIPKFLKRKPSNGEEKESEGNPLILHHVRDILKDLDQRHGSDLKAGKGDGRKIVLVIGSSVYDTWVHDEKEKLEEEKSLSSKTNATAAASNGSHGGRQRKWGRQQRRSMVRQRNLRGMDHRKQSESSVPRNTSSSSNIKEEILFDIRAMDRTFESDHLLACHEFIDTIRNLYPNVQLVWRSPLFVPNAATSTLQLWQVEQEMMKTWNVPTWDLYTTSYVAWVSQQQHKLDATYSGGTGSSSSSSSSSNAYNSYHDFYDPGFYQQVSKSALLVPDQD